MALIVEDGTGLATSESYISVADADTRHSNLNNTAWTGTTAVKEAALRRATQYMLQAYRQRWTGVRAHYGQALCWPRYSVMVDSYPVQPTVVPTAVANACADLALKALAGDLNADLTQRVLRDKAGPLETEYDRFSPQQTRYPSIEMALAPYLNGSQSTMRLQRA